MIGQAGHQRMAVVQVEVDWLAQPADRADDVLHVTQRAADRGLDVVGQFGQPRIRHIQAGQPQAGMVPGEPRARLPHADVADVDTAADLGGVPQPFDHLDETAWLQADRVLQEQRDVGRLFAQERVQVVHGRQPAAVQVGHATAVMNDQAGDPAGEAPGELAHHRPAVLVQQVGSPVQVDDGQPWPGGREPQHVPELIGGIGVDLGGHAHLGEPELGQAEQRVVPRHALLEQRVHRLSQLRLRTGLLPRGSDWHQGATMTTPGRIPAGPVAGGESGRPGSRRRPPADDR